MYVWWGVEGVCGVCMSVVCEYVRGGGGGGGGGGVMMLLFLLEK